MKSTAKVLLLVAAFGSAVALNYRSNQPQLYDVLGSFDVGTLENSIFSWHGKMYLLENIGCGYLDHYGTWDAKFSGHSYVRIQELETGNIVANISETISTAFVSAFPDYQHDRLWLFGIDFDRCHGTHKGQNVVALWNTEGGDNLTQWSTSVAIPNFTTYNVEVAFVNNSESTPMHATNPGDACFEQGRAACEADKNCAAFGTRENRSIQLHGCVSVVPDQIPWRIYNKSDNYTEVGGNINVNESMCSEHPAAMSVPCNPTPPPPLPPHNYVMILEPFHFMVNNATDGNLTRGWTQIASQNPPTGSGGPSIRYSRGYYYIITGGDQVRLARTKDFHHWVMSPRGSLIYPSEADGLVAPYAGFNLPASTQGGSADETNAQRKGFVPGMNGSNYHLWDWNSNDGDVCCMEPGSTESWLVWGASSQGRKCNATHCCTNALGHNATSSLPDLLEAMFA